jgi:hypothetical protein
MGQRSRGLELKFVERTMYEAGFGDVISKPLPLEPNVKGPALFLLAGTKTN